MFIVGLGSLSTEVFYSIHLNRAVLTDHNNLTSTLILFSHWEMDVGKNFTVTCT